MREIVDIFKDESYRGTGIKTVSANTIVTIVLSAISVIAGIFIVANWGSITAKIAIWMADFISSGLIVLIVVGIVIYYWTKFKWKLRSRFWNW
ncbi:MAG: hypothetical protein K6G88_03785 [Lachnospiraceae bacterium]|nr:hypothetical protein [Lachnospiraceae bacterium]